MLKKVATLAGLTLLAACADVSYVQQESPANAYKDYSAEALNQSAILGVGEPMSRQQMRANALLSLQGRHGLEHTMNRLARTYNVAVRWGEGVRKSRPERVLIKELTFDEARNYIEDVYNVQIIREGERRLLVLPSASEPRVAEFSPGRNVTLAQAVNGLAEQCGFNMVIAENISLLQNTRITTNMRDVTCYDAFDALLTPHGMSLVDRGGYYNVGGLPTRQWTLNLHEPNKDSETEVSYSATTEGESEESGSSQEFGGSAKVTVSNERRLWEKLEEDLNTLLESVCAEYARATATTSAAPTTSELLPPPTDGTGATETVDATGDIFSDVAATTAVEDPAACGYMRINQDVGLVQMRAPQTVLDEADQIINHVEDIAGRRLMLEARVLAVKRERDFQQGGSLSADFGGTETSSPAASSVAAAVNQTLVDLGVGATGLRTQVDIGDLTTVLRLVEEFGTTYQLMQPTIELMDRQQATLIDGINQPFNVREVDVTDGDTPTISITNDLRYQFFGMQFSATAQIADDGEPHTISVQIPILSRTGDFSIPLYNGTVIIGNDTVPIAETRLIDQKVRLRDGEIKVIGGLTKTVAVDRETGVPLLRDIPLAGKTMNAENIDYENVEFVVLLQARRIY